MPLQKKKSQSSLHRQQQQQQCHPHPLKSNSVSAATSTAMRRPTFLLRRLRSKSVPGISFPDVSAVESSLIFSAAQRATARRRRPFSEYSPGPSTAFSSDDDTTPKAFMSQSIEKAEVIDYHPVNRVVKVSVATEQRPTISACPHPLSRKQSFSSDDSGLCSDDDSSPSESESPATTPTIVETPRLIHPQPLTPLSPKRVVENVQLKAYADGLFAFTQTCLSSAAVGSPVEICAPIPYIQVDDTDFDLGEQDDVSIIEQRPSRPPLVSHFSDWSQTNTEADITDIEDNDYSRWSSAVQTPNWPLRRVPESSEPMSPDSYFAETTPRVAQNPTWNAAMSSPAWSTTASSDAGGLLHSSRTSAISESSQLPPSPPPTGSFSYFADFDSHTAAAESEYGLPLDFALPDIRRPSPFTPGTMLVKPANIGPSASDMKAFNKKILLSPAATQMSDVSVRPPSWLIRAIG